jgi:prepilin-type N-terminal cleavage/methylation domain-containing protein
VLVAPARSRRVLAGALGALLGALFIIAALGKAWRVAPFLAVLGHLAPEALSAELALVSIAFLVIGVEAFVGARLLAGTPPRWLLVAVLALLILFCIALIKLALDPVAPSCGCLGPFQGERHDAASGLARNAAMLWIVLWLLWQESSAPRAQPLETRSIARTGNARAGFTIVELLVVIGLIAVLVSLVAPLLRPAKESAVRTRSLSTCHQLLVALATYSAESREYFPYFATPGDPAGPMTIGGVDLHAENDCSYFKGQMTLWPSLIVPDHFDARQAIETEQMRQGLAERGYPAQAVRTLFFLSQTVHAAPEFFVGDETPDDLTHFRGTTVDEVAFPASKGLVLDAALVDRDVLVPVGAADGSGRLFPYPGPDPENVVERFVGGFTPWPIMATRGGLRGIDF